MAHLVKIGFGPVHGFITAARKLEDLCSGSTMLSELMEEAAKTLGGDLIYPVLPSEESKANMPNIMLLKTDSCPVELAKKVVADIKKEFRSQVERAVRAQRLDIDSGLLDRVIDRQTSGFVETVWSAVELGPSFETSLAELNMRFDAAKRTRIFSQQEEPGMKCTLQTNLSTLAPIFEKGNPDQMTKAWWKGLENRDMNTYEGRALQNSSKLAQKGERFSSIGLAKRVKARIDRDEHKHPHHFPSTYAVATAMWRKRIFDKFSDADFKDDVFSAFFEKWCALQKQKSVDFNEVPDDVIPALKELRDTLDDRTNILSRLLTCEAQCFRKTEFVLIDAKGKTPDDPIGPEREALIGYTREIGAGSPPGHYVLLSADGDSMGRFVDACGSVEALKELSCKLKDFSEQAIRTIESPEVCGRVIYAGGDDVLAVMPVDAAIQAACSLRRDYSEKLAGITYMENGRHVPATLSVALIFAPDNYPLHRLLDNAEAALNGKAKAFDKNALSITVYKGGSEVCSTVLPTEAGGWKLQEWIEGRLGDEDHGRVGLRNLFDSKKLSSKTMYDLHRDLLVMETGGKCEVELIKSVVMGRIATNRELKDEEIRDVQLKLNEFFDAIHSENNRRGPYKDHAMEGRRDDFRNNAPSFIASTLISLRNIWRMQCLSK